jgi:hypothetical protein
MSRPWSPSVRLSVAQHVLHTLSDAGLLGAKRRGIRSFLSYTPGLPALAWLLLDLHDAGVSDDTLPDHPDFEVLQLDRGAVLDGSLRLAERVLFEVQAGADQLRNAWPAREHYLDRLTELPDVG